MGLNLDGDIEVLQRLCSQQSPSSDSDAWVFESSQVVEEWWTSLDNGIHSEWNGAHGPQHHHDPWQAIRLLLPPVVPYLRDQLDAPENRTDGAKDIGGDGNGRLRRHCSSRERTEAKQRKREKYGTKVKNDKQLGSVVRFDHWKLRVFPQVLGHRAVNGWQRQSEFESDYHKQTSLK